MATDKEIDIALEEFKQLRADIVVTKAEMQKTFIYSLTLAALGLAFLGNIFEKASQSIIQTILLMLSGIFFLITLNYISHMRHYVFLSNYIFNQSKFIRAHFFDSTKTILTTETENRNENIIKPVLAWELYQIKKYSRKTSKFIFFFSYGSQPFFPITFGILCFASSVMIDIDFNLLRGFDKMYNNVLGWCLLIIFLITAYCMIIAIIELFTYIKYSKTINKIETKYN